MEISRLLAAFREAPVSRWTGARLAFGKDRAAHVTLPVRREFLQTGGIAHGGLVAFAADTSAWFTAAAACDAPVLTADFSLHLLRPVGAGESLVATAEIVRKGRRLVVVEARVRDGSRRLVAQGLWSHAVVR